MKTSKQSLYHYHRLNTVKTAMIYTDKTQPTKLKNLKQNIKDKI